MGMCAFYWGGGRATMGFPRHSCRWSAAGLLGFTRHSALVPRTRRMHHLEPRLLRQRARSPYIMQVSRMSGRLRQAARGCERLVIFCKRFQGLVVAVGGWT